MHKEILNQNQINLLILLKEYKREYYMVGGTAIALHLGHRMSIDFDMFKLNTINKNKILEKIKVHNFEFKITRNVTEQLNLIINEVKFTFFQYPYKIEAKINFENLIKIPDLITLAAMKAYALGRRSKWKDYVDLYFILVSGISIEEIFRIQLSFFDDIDFSEEVFYINEKIEVADIKKFLIKISSDIAF